jgi:hypothetical protein
MKQDSIKEQIISIEVTQIESSALELETAN